ncbi:MAG: 1-phosphofructokinase family hexose kinase [Clostridia bacterium]|nr:1-phosphofructokinase family hexose kinase [Clostridia bacterium]
MILTICPNPSIDCTIELDSLNVGMLNRIDNKLETYSGKALNVAIGVARLNEDCLSTGFMFDNHRVLFEKVLDKEGVKHNFVYNEGNARTNYKIIDKRSMLTEINDRGEEVCLEKQTELLEKIKELSNGADIAVISGSLPKGVSSEFYGLMVKSIPENVRVVVDAEKDNTLSAIGSRKIFMVKPNLKEFEKFFGITVRSRKDIVEGAKRYLEMGVENVLVSLGTEGAVLVNANEQLYCTSTSVAVNSTVGAGDSMVAAACVGITRKLPMQEVLRMAVSAGTAAVTTSGTNLFYIDKYQEIYNKIKVEQI